MHVQIDTNRALTFASVLRRGCPPMSCVSNGNLNMLQKRIPILRRNSYDPFSSVGRRFEIRLLRLARPEKGFGQHPLMRPPSPLPMLRA